jgi:carbamoyltransferase
MNILFRLKKYRDWFLLGIIVNVFIDIFFLPVFTIFLFVFLAALIIITCLFYPNPRKGLFTGTLILFSICSVAPVFYKDLYAQKAAIWAYFLISIVIFLGFFDVKRDPKQTSVEISRNRSPLYKKILTAMETAGRSFFFSIFYVLIIGPSKIIWLVANLFKKHNGNESYWETYSPSETAFQERRAEKKRGDIYILGISAFYHDASAALIKNGKLIAAVAEERLSRIKHDNSFPQRAIEYCLDKGGIMSDDLSYVGFYEIPAVKLERIILTFIKTFPFSFPLFLEMFPSWITHKFFVKSIIRESLHYRGKIIFIDHHLSHAASVFFPSPFREADIITIDGVGEWTTATYGYGKDNKIQIEKRLKFPDSLGLFYSTFTAFLGFKVNEGEYKVMGLAPYGKPVYLEKIRKLIDVKEDGSLSLNMRYFAYEKQNRMFSKKLIRYLGIIPRQPDGPFRKCDEDLARSVQEITNEIMVKMANSLQLKTGRRYLCLAGGVGLNCVANSEILNQTKYRDLFVYPDPGDGGGAVGVAYYIWNMVLANESRETLEDVFFGSDFNEESIKTELDRAKIKYHYYSEKPLIEKVAKLIKKQKIVAWFQGKMEFGPRALGNRSIIADPRNPKNREIVNAKIKFREAFRPFAPSVLEDKAGQFFEMGKKKNSPYMIFVFQAKSKKLPAVVHFDGTSRIQTVSEKTNRKYYALIRKFGQLTGMPVILNTSFNRRGEPIVCTPGDALKCFFGSGLDYLVMGNYLISKEENLKVSYD